MEGSSEKAFELLNGIYDNIFGAVFRKEKLFAISVMLERGVLVSANVVGIEICENTALKAESKYSFLPERLRGHLDKYSGDTAFYHVGK